MKKFSSILLIAVLAMSCVFAAVTPTFDAKLTGTATASYVFGVDKGEFGKSATTWVNGKGAAGLSISYKLSAKIGTNNDKYWGELAVSQTLSKIDATVLPTVANISTFAIHKADVWTLDLLKATVVGNFASTKIENPTAAAIDLAKYALSAASPAAGGFTFTWNAKPAKAYTFSAIANRAADQRGDYYIGVATPSYSLIDGKMTMKGAALISFNQKSAWNFGASYEITADTEHVDVTVDTDQYLARDSKTHKSVYSTDVAAKASFGPKADFAIVDLYYAHTADTDRLSAQAQFKCAAFNPDQKYGKVTATVQGFNLLKEERVFNADVAIAVTDDFSIDVYGQDLLDDQIVGVSTEFVTGMFASEAGASYDVEGKVLGVSAGTAFTPKSEKFVASANVAAAISTEGVKDDNSLTFGASFVAADTWVANTTLTAAYESGNLIEDVVNETSRIGNVTVSAAIKF